MRVKIIPQTLHEHPFRGCSEHPTNHDYMYLMVRSEDDVFLWGLHAMIPGLVSDLSTVIEDMWKSYVMSCVFVFGLAPEWMKPIFRRDTSIYVGRKNYTEVTFFPTQWHVYTHWRHVKKAMSCNFGLAPEWSHVFRRDTSIYVSRYGMVGG